ncbi:MAG: DNA replication/repair protein RecF [Patescibacteria group bacterium]|jgi:DNA replication and repair protein RecF
MHINKLLLNNFRSYSERILEFSPQNNLILGKNGSGKSNILEAIYFLSTGKSFRSATLPQLLKWQHPYTIVRSKITRKQQDLELELQLIREEGSASIKRKFLIDKVEKSRKNYLGTFKVVIFQPEDIRLVTGSPSRRREYLDDTFSSIDWRYASALSQYNKALKHRNELLDQIRQMTNTKNELFYWDQSLIKNDKIIHDHRLAFTRHVNSFYSRHTHPEIQTLSLNYKPSILSQEKLDSNYSLDLSRGFTQSGCHRDDFSFDSSIFPYEDKNLSNWGSRGQQRLAVLALRLAQIQYLEKIYQEKPLLLLDDIFSELDPEHQQLVSHLSLNYQTIFTSSEDSSAFYLPSAKIIRL